MFASFTTIARIAVSAVVLAVTANAVQAGQHGQFAFAGSGQGYAVSASSRFAMPVRFEHGGRGGRAAHNGAHNGRTERKIAKIERKEHKLQMKLVRLERREQQLRRGR